MIGYVGRRLLQLLPVLLIGSIGIFAMIYAIPGGPVGLIVGENATQEQIAAVTEQLGLNDPVPVQYGRWLTGALRGDLGTSIQIDQSVSSLIASRLPATFQLGAVAILFGVVLSIPMAIITARWPGSAADRAISGYAALVLGVPTFWLGILFILFFSVRLGIFPAASSYVPLWEEPLQAMKSLLLPAATLGFYTSGIFVRFLRASLLGELRADYVRTAKSKGVKQGTVLTHHVLRNAMLPFVTVVGLQTGAFIGGAVVTEAVFTYPGLGRMLIQALGTRDYPLVQGTILVVLVLYVIVNVVVDVAYAYLDPRIEYH
ncbi:MAG TPA: ABC transporter permease [Acidimicrobiia bacterium]|nr:ABC transporter permease [Acidimicrobiia bacterium]